MLAISEGGDSDIKRIRILISEGEDVEALNSKGQSSLHIAAQQGHVEVIKVLIAGKASIEAKNQQQPTPLHIAASAGQEGAVLALVRAKADVNARDRSKNTVLAVASDADCRLTLQIAGADGWKPLMVAVKTENTEDYLRFRELICCMKEGRSFPLWFVEDVSYYSNLGVHQKMYTWDQLGVGVNLNEDKRIASHQDVGVSSYTLGNEIFKDGVHMWTIAVDDVGSMWVGIGRNVDEEDLLGQSGCDCPDRCTLAFPSDGSNALIIGRKGVQAKKFLSGFKSGDCIKLELDTHKHFLKMSVNGVLAFTAWGVDDVDVRPLVIMDRGSVALIDVGLTRQQLTVRSISAEDYSMCLDNAKWSPISFETLASVSGNFFVSSIDYVNCSD
jgi:hypothetical protein